MPEDIGAAEDMIADWQRRATENAQKFQDMRAEVEKISVTESSPNDSVTVTVGSNGLLQDVHISESARRRPMSQLTNELMRTLQKAQARIPELMQEAIADTVGMDDPMAKHAFDEARQAFPEDPDDDSAPARDDVDDNLDEDWDEGVADAPSRR